jgi:hypothetical protein
MNDNKPPASWADRAIGLGSGLASALLFAASTRGTSLALALAYFAPLPAVIGALGFSLSGAFAGSILGAFLLANFGQPLLGIAFFLGFALPALLASALARHAVPAREGDASPAPRFCSPGALLAALLGAAVVAAWIGVAALIDYFHGFDAALEAMLRYFGPEFDDAVLKKMSGNIDPDTLKRLILLCAPAGFAASQMLLLGVNMWIGGRTVEISGRLGRPWPDLPETLALPRFLAPIFVVAFGLSFIGGLTGAVAGALAATSGVAFAIQGLATLHAFSRTARYRGLILAALYAAVFALEPWPLMLLALFGLVESVLSLRARRTRRLSTKLENPTIENL